MLISVKNQSISFAQNRSWVKVTDHINLNLSEGQTLGIAGESGCGKSITASSLMGLLPQGKSRVEADEFLITGKCVKSYTESDWRVLRGKILSMVFQNPMTALNPLMKSGKQIEESLHLHLGLSGSQKVRQAKNLIGQMGIEDVDRIYTSYPWELSGGLRQRIMLALALAPNPRVLIADEPTTALDVTVQAQILSLIRDHQKQMGMALLLITHDLGVMAQMVDDVLIAYAGQIVESGPVKQVLTQPLHPYTKGLISSIPRLFQKKVIQGIPGRVPSPEDFPEGCRFAPRCSRAQLSCSSLTYILEPTGTDFRHSNACPLA